MCYVKVVKKDFNWLGKASFHDSLLKNVQYANNTCHIMRRNAIKMIYDS